MNDIIHKIKHKDNSYTFTIEIPIKLGFIDNVNIVIDDKYINMKYTDTVDEKAIFKTGVNLETKARYNYYFTFNVQGIRYEYKKTVKGIINDGKWSLSVGFETPKWTHGKIMYHIFTDRFNKTKEIPNLPNRIVHKNWNEELIIGPNKDGRWNIDFYGGSLEGITEKLDYIKSLGASIIYLSPIFLSQSNHRYDISDYEMIDPYLGDFDDLKNLCTSAHKKGIKIILDAVFNHTGNDSKYFNEYNTFDTLGAYQDISSPYYAFYRKNGNSFDYWWGMKNLPVCDGNSKKWQDYIYGVDGIIDKWFSYGIDGLRLDVADELTDEFIEGIRKAVKRNKTDGFILGEVWKNPMRMNRGYISSGRGMDSVMNYQLVDALIRYFKYADTHRISEIVNQLKTEYPKETLLSLMNFTSTHDISRALNIFGSDRFKEDGQWAWDLKNEDYAESKDYNLSESQYKKGLEIYKSYVFTLAFFPGILSIFYGDEIGMQGEGNLLNRKPYTWNRVDRDLLQFFRFIGNVRKRETFLEIADIDVIDINKNIIIFERKDENDSLLTIVNRTDREIDIDIPKEYENHQKKYTLKKSKIEKLYPHGAIALKK